VALIAFLGRLLYGFRVEGRENLPPSGPYIIVSNEIGPMGTTFVAVTVARLVLSGAIKELVGFGAEDIWWTQKRLADMYTRSGAQPVSPGQGQSAATLLVALQALRQGKVVAMNPEGDMTWDGRLVPLQPGVAWLSLRSGAPIVPIVSTQGGYDIWPKWADRPYLTGRCLVRIGSPFTLADAPQSRVTEEMTHQGMQRIWDEMTRLIYAPDSSFVQNPRMV